MLGGRFVCLVLAGFCVVACGGGNDNPFVEGADANGGKGGSATAGSAGRATGASTTSSTTRGGGGNAGGGGSAGSGGGEAGSAQMVDADSPDVEGGTSS